MEYKPNGIGDSTGAMIFPLNIEYAIKMDDPVPGFRDFTGLGAVDFYPFLHFNSFPLKRLPKL